MWGCKQLLHNNKILESIKSEWEMEVICGPDIKRGVGGRYVCGCLRGKRGFGEGQRGPVVITSDLSARSRASHKPLQMHPVCKPHVPQSERERLSVWGGSSLLSSLWQRWSYACAHSQCLCAFCTRYLMQSHNGSLGWLVLGLKIKWKK